MDFLCYGLFTLTFYCVFVSFYFCIFVDTGFYRCIILGSFKGQHLSYYFFYLDYHYSVVDTIKGTAALH